MFDKAEWNLKMWQAEGNGNLTDQFTSIDAFAEKMSESQEEKLRKLAV